MTFFWRCLNINFNSCLSLAVIYWASFTLAKKLTVANCQHIDKIQTTVFSCWGFCNRGCTCSSCCCTVGRGLILSTLDIWQVLREAEPFAMLALRRTLPTTPSPWSTVGWKTTKIFISHGIKGGLIYQVVIAQWLTPWLATGEVPGSNHGKGDNLINLWLKRKFN